MAKIKPLIDISTQVPTWLALYTRHQHEKSVAELLSAKDVQTFLPLYKSARRWKDRIKQLSLPLFPNYVFVFAGLDRRATILSTIGVHDFVRRGGTPAPISIEEIEAVRSAVDRGLQVEPHPYLNTGDRVRVKSGALEGLEGILTRKKSFYRLILSVELLMQSISVEVDVADVERVAEGGARVGSAAKFVAVHGGN